MENPVIIFGANPLGRTAKDIFESNKVVVYGFLDDNKKLHSTEVDDAVVLGSTDDDGFLKLIGKKCEAFVAVDDNKVRRNLVKMLRDVRHVLPVNAVHRLAALSPRGSIGYGNFFDAGCTTGAGSTVGSHCLFGAGSHLGAESIVGDFVQVGAGAVINSGVTIEEDVFIGTGAIVVSGVTLEKGARIGAGSVVISTVKAGTTVFGNPAHPVKA
jgi:sugar O-acyltransferase (sialic acid O-acetyltransferase NeuD family)